MDIIMAVGAGRVHIRNIVPPPTAGDIRQVRGMEVYLRACTGRGLPEGCIWYSTYKPIRICKCLYFMAVEGEGEVRGAKNTQKRSCGRAERGIVIGAKDPQIR